MSGRPGRRRLRRQRHQALHQPRRPRRLHDPVRRDRGGEHPQGAQEADHVIPRRPRHAGPRVGAWLQLGVQPRLPQSDPELRRLSGAGVEGAGRGEPGLRGGQRVAGLHPPAGCLGVPGAGRPGDVGGAGLGRVPGAVRPEDRKVPGCVVQVGRHAHQDGRGRADDLPGGVVDGPWRHVGWRRGHGQDLVHRDAAVRIRRGHPDPGWDGPDGGVAAGAHLAGCPCRPDLGRHERDPTSHP